MKKRPNFIIIHADQLRYDCIGVTERRTGIYTPFIDSIAHRGVNFTACYATCPLCSPQRMSLLSGLTPDHHGMFGNVGIPYFPLETTLPAEMRRSGYQTALVGRTMHTRPEEYSYGFEYYLPGDPSSGKTDTTDAFFRYLREHSSQDCGGYYGCGAQNNARVATPFHLPDHLHQTKWTTNRAIDFLKTRDSSRPYMLFVGYYAPHSPHNPPAHFFNRYYNRNDLDDPCIGDWAIAPQNNGAANANYIHLQGEELRVTRAGYYGNIAFMDAQIGRLLSAVQDSNTYIIFTADHGDILGDHYFYQKNRPYEGATHIPLMIMGPDVSFGTSLEHCVGWHDLMPTILDLAGISIPQCIDGRSFAPLLNGTELSDWRPYIHGECVHSGANLTQGEADTNKCNVYYEQGSQYLTDGKIKYIWYATTGREQLFNLQTDCNECHDLSQDPAWHSELELWRKRLIQELDGRPEGYSDGEKLIPGCKPQRCMAHKQPLYRKRKQQGFTIGYEQKKSPLEQLDYQDHLMR